MDHEASSHKPWDLILPIQIKQIIWRVNQVMFLEQYLIFSPRHEVPEIQVGIQLFSDNCTV